MHVDYEDDHDVHEEHKPLYERAGAKKGGWRERIFGPKKGGEVVS